MMDSPTETAVRASRGLSPCPGGLFHEDIERALALGKRSPRLTRGARGGLKRRADGEGELNARAPRRKDAKRQERLFYLLRSLGALPLQSSSGAFTSFFSLLLASFGVQFFLSYSTAHPTAFRASPAPISSSKSSSSSPADSFSSASRSFGSALASAATRIRLATASPRAGAPRAPQRRAAPAAQSRPRRCAAPLRGRSPPSGASGSRNLTVPFEPQAASGPPMAQRGDQRANRGRSMRGERGRAARKGCAVTSDRGTPAHRASVATAASLSAGARPPMCAPWFSPGAK